MRSERKNKTNVLNIFVGPHRIPGTLAVPERARGVVVFAHGSGSCRFSPRNQFVARRMHDKGLATLLFDLQGEDRRNVFDIDLIAQRLLEATDWVAQQERDSRLADRTVRKKHRICSGADDGGPASRVRHGSCLA